MKTQKNALVYIPLGPEVVAECEAMAAEYAEAFGQKMTGNDIFEAAANMGLNAIRHIIETRRATVSRKVGKAAHVH